MINILYVIIPWIIIFIEALSSGKRMLSVSFLQSAIYTHNVAHLVTIPVLMGPQHNGIEEGLFFAGGLSVNGSSIFKNHNWL